MAFKEVLSNDNFMVMDGAGLMDGFRPHGNDPGINHNISHVIWLNQQSYQTHNNIFICQISHFKIKDRPEIRHIILLDLF